jgi:sugar lactone lactonase YvrE
VTRERRTAAPALVVLGLLAACRSEPPARTPGAEVPANPVPPAAPRQVAVVRDLATPESVHYDAALDVWFVANINGGPLARDDNGWIARLHADGTVDSLHFVQGGRNGVRLDAPKGIAIVADTLWVADIDALRAFDTRTGRPIATVSLAGKAKFLNDVAVGPDGIYVTDTGIASGKDGNLTHPGPDRIFRIDPSHKASIALETDSLQGPNGITWDSAGHRFIVVPFFGATLRGWTPGLAPVAIGTGPGQQDGVEVIASGRFLISSWADSSLFVLDQGRTTRVVGGLPSPADIGWDPGRRHVAVPVFLENRVEIWELP